MRIDVADLHWLLGSLCQLNCVPFSADLIEKELPPPHTLPSVLDGMRRLGFEAESRAVRLNVLEKLPVPFVALVNAGAAQNPDQAPPTDDIFRPVLVVRAEGGRVLCFAAGSVEPTHTTLEEFGRQYTGRVILFRRRAEAPQDPDAVAATGHSFGFRWFLPVLLKHRELWRDVLRAPQETVL